MRIESIYLKGYKRFSLSGMQTFEMEIGSPLSLILGTNGSGKSSLLFALSPLPPIRADFEKDGIKKIVVTKNGVLYTLVSEVKGKTIHHSCIKGEGEEMNPGGTGAIQKEIVERELGFTQHLQDVLTGRTKLTTMAPSKRREWFMRLSDSDLTYALKVFDRITTSERDATGALKHQKNRLTKETARLVDTDKVDLLEEKVKELNHDVQVLLKEKTYISQSSSELLEDIERTGIRLESKSSIIRRLTINGVLQQGTDLETVADRINEVSRSIGKNQASYDHVEKELSSITEILDSVEGSDIGSLEEIEGKLTVLYENQERMGTVTDPYGFIGPFDELHKNVIQAREVLPRLISDLPSTIVPTHNREECIEIAETLKDTKQNLADLETRRSVLQQRKQRILSSKDNTCPECKHTWKEGFSENDISKLDEELPRVISFIEQIEEDIKKQEAFLDEYRLYIQTHKRFKDFFHNFPKLYPLWYRFMDERLIETGQNLMLSLVDEAEGIISRRSMQEVLLKEIQETEKARDYLQGMENVQSGKLKSRLVELNDSMNFLLKEKEELRKDLKVLEYRRDCLNSYGKAMDESAGLVDELETKIKRLMGTIRAEVIEETLNENSSRLAVLQNKLNERDTLQGIVSDIRQSVESLELDYEALKLLSKSLSPKGGIISKQMRGFLGCLVGQMNKVISSIWEYELNILPWSKEEGELSYKLPMRIVKDGRENSVDDVAEGSSAQKDVVDFAFTLIVMLYMDLRDYPLYLDELGISFDPTHRDKLVVFIKQLLEGKQCSQIFLVSHYATFSGSLSNAEICVLDKTNIAVPDTYNTHVKIT